MSPDKKVVFTSLGPNRQYTTVNGQQYEDGDIAFLDNADYESAVVKSKFAQDYTEELYIATVRLVKTAKAKRDSILAKVNKK